MCLLVSATWTWSPGHCLIHDHLLSNVLSPFRQSDHGSGVCRICSMCFVTMNHHWHSGLTVARKVIITCQVSPAAPCSQWQPSSECHQDSVRIPHWKLVTMSGTNNVQRKHSFVSIIIQKLLNYTPVSQHKNVFILYRVSQKCPR